MIKKEADQLLNKNLKLIGQRWKNNSTGKVETIIDLRIVELIRFIDGWGVFVVFIPESEGFILNTREYHIDSFFKDFTRMD